MCPKISGKTNFLFFLERNSEPKFHIPVSKLKLSYNFISIGIKLYSRWEKKENAGNSVYEVEHSNLIILVELLHVYKWNFNFFALSF